MTLSDDLTYGRACWPDEEVPAGSPLWMYYEISHQADAVFRMVEVFADGKIARNSVDLEQRNGDNCPSLLDMPLDTAFEAGTLQTMSREAFKDLWVRGVDTPFWFPG